ncbi:MAG: methylated-DNA--[protein]-cysteine S-methyltransferase [Planctomycetota bacterium]|jgi:methylated-DNA-[protein]-cysteine S-methyltransferase
MPNTVRAVRYALFKTRWGYFGLAGGDCGLLRTHLPLFDRDRVQSRLTADLGNAKVDSSLFKRLQEQIRAYFEGGYVDFHRDIPMPLEGLSPFARAVLDACRGIRYGQTISYGGLAKKARCPHAARAIGVVMAKNPMPLIIPCHRVVYSDGKIGGFSATGGVSLKKKMLSLERQGLRA